MQIQYNIKMAVLANNRDGSVVLKPLDGKLFMTPGVVRFVTFSTEPLPETPHTDEVAQ